MSRVTLSQVAQASGVSRATVSFVLNDAPGQRISPSTRERVTRVAHELGYVPHGLAKALREGASRIVVLYVNEVQEGNYSRSFIKGLDQELASHGHVLLVRYGDGSAESQKPVLDAIVPRAVVVFGSPYSSGQLLEDAGGGRKDGLAAHTATQISFLADRGHRQIVLAVPGSDQPREQARLRFSNQVAQELGLAPVEPIAVPSSRDGGVAAISALRADRPEVTAVAAFDDPTALRILAALHDLGLTAPADLAVIGFDAGDYGALASPGLTSVHIDAEAHGRLYARRVLGLDESGIESASGRVIVRESA